MKIDRAAIAAFLMAISILPLRANPAPAAAGTVVSAPAWSVGSDWYYSDGYALKVTSTMPGVATFDRVDAPGQWFSREGFVRKDSVSATATRTSLYRTVSTQQGFSVTAGNPTTFQREYLSNGKLMVHASSLTLEGQETITVPAGTFDCWIIVWRTRSLKDDWTGFERWWYSPKAQQYVRLEYKYGSEAEGSRVLMRYQLGGVGAGQPISGGDTAAALTDTANERAPQGATPPSLVKAPKAIVPAPATSGQSQKHAQADIPAFDPRSAERPLDKPEKPTEAPEPKSFAVNTAQPTAINVPHTDSPPSSEILAMASSPEGNWHAQIGSSKDAAAMRTLMAQTISANPGLESLPHGIAEHIVKQRGTFYRAWFGAFDHLTQARAVCGAVKAAKPGCSIFKAAVPGAIITASQIRKPSTRVARD